jgi:hypothetical protein
LSGKLRRLKARSNLILTLRYKKNFPRQSLKIFAFRVKLSDSIFFLFGHSSIAKLI